MSENLDAAHLLTPEQISDGWRPHDGGSCPFGFGVAYQVMKYDGFVSSVLVNRISKDWLSRSQKNRSNHIIAYRTFTVTNAGWRLISEFEHCKDEFRLVDCLVVWGQEVVAASWKPDVASPAKGDWFVGLDSDRPQVIYPSHFQAFPALPWNVEHKS